MSLWPRIKAFITGKEKPQQKVTWVQTYAGMDKRTTRCGYHTGKLSENIELLAMGQLDAIPWIFCVLAEPDTSEKGKAAKALAETLSRLTFDETIRLDTLMRDKTSMEWHIDWSRYHIEDLITPEMDMDSRRAVTVLASFHPNGYLREKALRQLVNYEASLPYIALRLNDWAWQVRAVAGEGFRRRLANPSQNELLMSLPYVEKTLRGRRGRPELAALVFDALCSDVNRDELLSGLQSSVMATRRLCIRALFASKTPDTALALTCLAKEREPFLRAMLFRGILNAGVQAREAALVLLEDKFPPNRSLALLYLRDNSDADIQAIAFRLLLDKNAGIRALAREIISIHQSETDFRAFYLDALQAGNASAILGLGEMGVQTDAALAAPFLASEASATASAAMATVMRLNAPQYAGIVTGMLRDERPHIVKMAQRLIMKYRRADFAIVKAVLEETPYETTQRRCVQLLYAAPNKWNRLIYMLEAALSDNGETQRTACHYLSRWIMDFNKSYVMPSPQQRAEIEALITQQPAGTNPSILRYIGFSLA